MTWWPNALMPYPNDLMTWWPNDLMTWSFADDWPYGIFEYTIHNICRSIHLDSLWLQKQCCHLHLWTHNQTWWCNHKSVSWTALYNRITGSIVPVLYKFNCTCADLLSWYPVVAVLPLAADLTASWPALHIFGGFCIYTPLNVQIVVGATAGELFLSMEKSDIKKIKLSYHGRRYIQALMSLK